jgi:hypothetical protein
MRSLRNAVGLIALASIVGTSAAQAQGGVAIGYTDVGAVLGLGGLGGASIAVGGRFERIFKALPDIGDGLLGIQVGADWWSWNHPYFGGNRTRVSYVTIGVTANYHFKVENKKFDPFVGAGLGYEIVNVNASCVYLGVDYCGSYSSGIYVITKAGIRYFMNPSTALYADVGVGAATLNVGAMFRMKGGS